MKELVFDYYMQIDYSKPVYKCNYTIKCIPVSNKRQRIEDVKIDIFPKGSQLYSKDGLNNAQLYGSIDEEHNMFYYHISGKAYTGLHFYEEKEDDNLSMIFRHPYGLNKPGESLIKYYQSIKPVLDGCSDEYYKAVELMHLIYRDFKYETLVTDIYTSAEEACTLGKGVCQDFAHIFIALLHMEGMAARYVTGLIVGEGASHAWVEILYDGKWYGLDPTNDMQVSTEHIKIGVGRHALDCMINRGIMHGGGLHTQTIKVEVK